ncbi:hypothetical protein NUITMVRE36_39770 [Enterococcus raffinosus]|nr:hypothetical protein NUITMVRE36_39770 [Enterococcus raffinosus]
MLGSFTFLSYALIIEYFPNLSTLIKKVFAKSEVNIVIYEKIKRLASKKGVSINRIEKDLGFSSSSISKWNSSNPTSSKLKQVADYLGVTMDYLLEDEKQEV